MIDRRELAEHLRLFGEIGVDGISRDPAWRDRADLERAAVIGRQNPISPINPTMTK